MSHSIPFADRVFLTSHPGRRALVVFLFLVAAGLRFSYPQVCYFNEFTERDWYRTYEIFTGQRFHTSGSELSQGGRLPNPYLYWLQLIPMAVSRNPFSLFFFVGLLNLLAMYYCYRFGTRYFGFPAGVASMALFAAFPLATIGLRYLWNPTLIFPFVAMTLYYLVALLDSPRPRYLYLLAVLIPLAISCHISGFYLVGLVILFLLIYRPKYSFANYATGSALFLAMFIPFLIGEVFNGWENLKPILIQRETIRMAGVDISITSPGRYRYNAAALHGLLFNLYPRLGNEYPYFGAFSYFAIFLERAGTFFPTFWMNLLHLVFGLARVHLILLLVAGVYAVWHWIRATLKGTEELPGLATRSGALLVCLALPILVLLAQSVMVFSPTAGVAGSGVHYFYIVYPTQFLLLGWLFGLGWNRFVGRRIWRSFLAGLLGVWVLLQVLVVFMQLHWSQTTGYFVRFYDTPVVHLGVMNRVADALVDDLGITRQTYITHVQVLDGILNYPGGTESGLDFLVNRHPRIKDAPTEELSETPPPFVYISDPSLKHHFFYPMYRKVQSEPSVEIGPLVLYVSSQGTPQPMVKRHPMLNPFIHDKE